jgi:hypothetical protein
LLHDERCKIGSVASQPKLHLQQTLPLLSPQPYKHPKTTKLNPNTPWMKQNYKKTTNIEYYCFLLSMNHYRHENPIQPLTILSDLLYWTFDPNFLHPMSSSIIMHLHNRWIESSLVNLHPFPFVMLHLEAHFPHPRHSNPTPTTIVLKLI